MSLAPAAACAALVAVLLAGEVRQHLVVRAVAKTGASFAFVAQGLEAGLVGSTFGRVVLAGLLLSVLGDVLLLGKRKALFLGGLVVFLLAHVAYVVAFAVLGVGGGALVVLGPLAAVGWVVWRWLAPHTGRLRGPVLAYVLVITAMVAAAGGAFLEDPGPVRGQLLAGALLFWLSDLFVARERFVRRDLRNKVAGLPLYYGGQLLIAVAAGKVGQG